MTAVPGMGLRGRACLAIAVLAVALAALAGTGSASAATSAAWFRLESSATPTNLEPGHEGVLSVSATNLGDISAEGGGGHPVTLTAVLPAGVTPNGARPVTCPNPAGTSPVCGIRWPGREETGTCEAVGQTVKCTFPEQIVPYASREVQIAVKVGSGVTPGTTSEVLSAAAEGGEATGSTLHKALEFGTSTPFGIENYELAAEDEAGGLEKQAGAHPFQFTTVLTLNKEFHKFPSGNIEPTTPEQTKNLHVNLPPGLIGNANKTIIHQCTELEFTTIRPSGLSNLCPPDTAIGAVVATLTEPNTVHNTRVVVPLFNLVPSKGEPARFGFVAVTVPVTLDTVLRGGDYHVVVNVNNVSQEPALLGSTVVVWGTPGDPRHDISRGFGCLPGAGSSEKCAPTVEHNPSPFLTLPTSCTGPLQSSVEPQSWVPGAPFLPAFGAIGTQSLEGCASVPFSPSMTIVPTQHESNTPTGLEIDLKVPQTTTLEADGIAESSIRNTVVTFPPGVQLSPSAADGLQSCSLAQIGFLKVNPTTGTDEFNESPAACPDASKVGTVEVHTPVLEQPLHGNVYIAAENENPFGSLFAAYIVVEDPITGVLVKLAGKVTLDQTTGQVTSTFPNAPQLPFEEFKLQINDGPRASFATPRACGSYSSFTTFEPWSGTAALSGPLDPNQFMITGGPGGTPCASPQPFSMGFLAGTGVQQAGAFTNFTLSLGRNVTDQAPTGVTVTLPPGLAGYLSNVTQCPEPQAEEGTCPESSLIGHATAVSGLGPDPFTIEGGRVYITGPYAGAPFGLSIVIPAKAGPFDFGNVVTRSTINVDRNTAALTVGSTLPTIVNTLTYHTGVPVQLRRVDVTIERPGNAPFQFNPTNCSPMSITGTLTGDEGATQTVSTPFTATGCDKLDFSPTLEAVTDSRWSRVNGTSLKVTVRAVPGQANIQKTKIVFPASLPSRLSTIQKACRDTTFEVNPADCPEGSVIGSAIAHTPVLNNPLVGPAYLVSHGNAAFPDAEFVLQGEGVTLILDGQTNIHNGITSSTFNSVPDAPVSTFEVTLPAGPHSAFTGFGDLCKPTETVTKKVTVKKKRGKRTVKVRKTVKVNVATKLVLPTILGGQNGHTIEETLPLRVTNCKAVKPFKKKKAAKKHRHHKKKKKKH